MKYVKPVKLWFKITLREKCPYSEFFRSAFSRIRTEYAEYLSVSSLNAVKYAPD